ncbi:MAG: hypothetical protein JST31_14655 [Actinobacteria bacterium]|nr:hypothetical protein [Actinomycetota bacterium]
MERASVPLADLCSVHLVDADHVRALIRAGRLPAPKAAGECQVETVPPDYLEPPAAPGAARSAAWGPHIERNAGRFADAQRRLVETLAGDSHWTRERQLTRMGTAAWAVGLSLLMDGSAAESRRWLDRCARSYRASLAEADPGSWGRSLGAIKSRILAGDERGSEREARMTLELGAAEQEGSIPIYAATLAHLVLGDDTAAAAEAERLVAAADFPPAVAATLAALAAGDPERYGAAVREVLTSFETRDRYLAAVPAADTVLVLQWLARPRGLELALRSPVLPAAGAGG